MNDGGPAFPENATRTDSNGSTDGIAQDKPGMTLRDYFAGQAISGIVSFENQQQCYTAVRAAYNIADLMLFEREL